MLVLSRYEKEEIVIQVAGEEIVITPVRIGKEKVRIGVEASQSVVVYRREVLDRRNQQNGRQEAKVSGQDAAASDGSPRQES